MKAVIALLLVCLLQLHHCEEQQGLRQLDQKVRGQVQEGVMKRQAREAEGKRKTRKEKKRGNRNKSKNPPKEKNYKEKKTKNLKKRNKTLKKKNDKAKKAKNLKKRKKMYKKRKNKSNKTKGKKNSKLNKKSRKRMRKQKQIRNKQQNKANQGIKRKSGMLRRKKVEKPDRHNYARNNKNYSNTPEDYTCSMYHYTRDYSLSRTELGLGRRINAWVADIERKAAKSSTAFVEIIRALNFSTDDGTSCAGAPADQVVTQVYSILKNCSTTVPKICDVGLIPGYNITMKNQLTENVTGTCLNESATYGPAYTDCIFKNSSGDYRKVCPCLVATKRPNRDGTPPCLPNLFVKLEKETKKVRKNCISPNVTGSWGNCMRNLKTAVGYVECPEAGTGPGGCRTVGCPGGSVTTVSPSGRNRRFQQKYWKYL